MVILQFRKDSLISGLCRDGGGSSEGWEWQYYYPPIIIGRAKINDKYMEPKNSKLFNRSVCVSPFEKKHVRYFSAKNIEVKIHM